MSEDVIDGVNFTCVHAGAMSNWMQYRLEPPVVPFTAKGKRFLKDVLGGSGLEISLNMVPPGRSMPFFHKHRKNDEIYFVIGGKGQFLIDGQCLDVQEGSVIRLSPPAVRAWRNHSDAPMHFLCIQYAADSVIQGSTSDGVGVEGKPVWPEASVV